MPKPKSCKLSAGDRVVLPPFYADLALPLHLRDTDSPELRGVVTRVFPGVYEILIDAKYRHLIKGWLNRSKDGKHLFEEPAHHEWVLEAGYKAPKPPPKRRGVLEFQSDSYLVFYGSNNTSFTLRWQATPKAMASAMRRAATWLDKHAKDRVMAEVD